MNVLTDKFPTKTIIDGKEYNLNTDFRTCLNIILAFEDEELLEWDKVDIMLENLYGVENIPENIDEAIKKAVLFLDCGETDEQQKVGKISSRLYSFSKDAKYIYSAIKQTHNIDLENIEYLHWWKFVYLFLDLDKDCFFCKMLDLRNKKAKHKLNKDEKKMYIELYDILELNNKREFTEEEQKEIDEFMQLINSEAGAEKEVN